MDNTAAKWVTDALRSCTPQNIPLPFTKILAATFLAKGRKNRTAVASLEMVDGLGAVIQVSKWGPFDDAWSLQWHEVEGGALYWDRNVGAWVRET